MLANAAATRGPMDNSVKLLASRPLHDNEKIDPHSAQYKFCLIIEAD
jgi:hypothetical protein